MTLLFEPFAPLFELSRELNRLAPGGTPQAFVPPADVVVSDDDVTVVMDVPGLKSDELSIELTDDVLTISGERAVPYDAQDGERRVWQRLERGFGRFERTLRIPKGLEADRVTADMVDGVLTLHIPKPEARRPRRIHITGSTAETAIEGTGTETRNGQSRLTGAPA